MWHQNISPYITHKNLQINQRQNQQRQDFWRHRPKDVKHAVYVTKAKAGLDSILNYQAEVFPVYHKCNMEALHSQDRPPVLQFPLQQYCHLVQLICLSSLSLWSVYDRFANSTATSCGIRYPGTVHAEDCNMNGPSLAIQSLFFSINLGHPRGPSICFSFLCCMFKYAFSVPEY
jgi:hypothetical protein